MITPAPMELISFVVLKDKIEEVASRMLALGVFHPVDFRSIEGSVKSLSSYQIDKEMGECDRILARIRDISRRLKMDMASVYTGDISSFSYSGSWEYLEDLDKKAVQLVSEKEELERVCATDEAILNHVKDYMPFPVKQSAFYSFLQVRSGRIVEKNLVVLEKSLADVPHVVYPFRSQGDKILVMLIGLRRDRPVLDKVMADVGWESIEYPSEAGDVSKEAQTRLVQKIAQTREMISVAAAKIADLSSSSSEQTGSIHSAVRVKRSMLEAKRLSCLTERTAVFSGWVPKADKDKVINAVKSISDISYIESHSPESMAIPKDEVPVQFSHNTALKPFEMLIDAYGIPRYGTVDPTIFVAFSFLIMFGAMFGDLGHGLVLALIGLLIGRRTSNQGLKHIKALLIYCGSSAAVFGLLYGSFFGFEFKSLWIKPIENIMEVFKISIYLGIAMISAGILINVINALRDKDYKKVFFDKAGLIGGVIYWAGIGYVTRTFISKEGVPPYDLFLILGGILILFLYPIVDCLMNRKFGHLMESVMESVVGVLEIFMGYLANTVSFIRVAAFALAHTGLFIAIFSLAKIVTTAGAGGQVVPWVVEIFGNILVICLEGLVVTIQAVRLNYYEFFSKFFITGKSVYKPLRI